MAVGADMTFEVSAPGRATAHGSLRGRDNRLVLEVDDPAVLGAAGDARAGRAIAQALASQGVRLRVVSRGVHVATVGAVRAPVWQRLATGSPHIRIGSARGLRAVYEARRAARS